MNSRKKPYELILYEYLRIRRGLSSDENSKYRKLKKGYEGELLFDAYIDKIQCDYLSLTDLSFSHNNKFFQVDNILLIDNTIYMYEVKNFLGNYYYENNKLFIEPQQEIDDPLTQLKRSEALLRQLLKYLGFSNQLQAKVVFVNPEFTLFQAPRSSKLLLPSQLNRYFHKFRQCPPLDTSFYQLGEKFQSISLEKSPYTQPPTYQYNELKKGIPCPSCYKFFETVDGRTCICRHCDVRESLQSAVLRTIEEFIFLFPEQRITTDKICDWIQLPVAQKRIRYMLNKNFLQKGKNKGAYYVKMEGN
ncbi:nuclease-related domain-containing protein [Gracilibacillus kekensis]|uniref:Nuclease-related domain-containing protein n=1 Tax=Gracilibacillus kekensis TaxID=1027249 RepID=A0A1M7Q9B6_9BACI|nr:nuclease-related domain-containing protein [Gracilibacillus kekensis]SHN27244.1 Nuclease-related domain-containing protein [Gracilibacillus kekensis]